jgi:hypothetical protein
LKPEATSLKSYDSWSSPGEAGEDDRWFENGVESHTIEEKGEVIRNQKKL